MHEFTKRIGAVLLAVAVVSTAVVGGLSLAPQDPADLSPVGTAEASHECGESLLLNLGIRSDLTTAQQTANIAGSCNPFHGDRSTESIDHSQTRTELVQRAATGFEHAEVELTALENNLENTKAVARLEMQAAYYRALEDGSSESAARASAKQAVRDYYTVKQQQLVSAWNILITSTQSYENVENSEGLSEGIVSTKDAGGSLSGNILTDDDFSNPTQDIAAVNGSQLTTEAFVRDYGGGKIWRYVDGSANGPSERTVVVGANNDSVSTAESVEFERYQTAWTDLENQSDDVLADADTYINQTYDSYEAGEINASDIIDANALTREYTGNNTQSWSTLALSTTSGVDPPEDLSQVGAFNVTHGGESYSGVLLADTEQVNTIENGTTYNGSQWAVEPKIVTSEKWVTLDGKFTVTGITNSQGESIQNASYDEVDYQTTNTTEYRNLMSELDALRAELEAREDQQGTGPLIPGFDLGGGGLAAGIGLVAIILLVAGASRNRGGRGARRRGR